MSATPPAAQAQTRDAIREAAAALLRMHLDNAEVHPCDTHNDAARARACNVEVQALFAALDATPAAVQGGDAPMEARPDSEQAKCAADVAFELHMLGEPTWQQVLEHLRMVYRDRCQQLQADLSRPQFIGWQTPAPYAAPAIDPTRTTTVCVGATPTALEAQPLCIAESASVEHNAACGSRTEHNALEAQPTQPTADVAMVKDHDVRNAVHALTAVAVQFHQAEQLRERIRGVVLPLVQRLRADKAAAVLAEREACAVTCDARYEKHAASGFPREASTARALAEAIRARKEPA